MRLSTVVTSALRRLCLLAILVALAVPAFAQEAAEAPAAAGGDLALRQGRIADKYARLEQLMLKMAEIDGASNPKRAALLKQAVQQSKDNLTRTQLETIVKLIDQRKLSRAVDGQGEVTGEMKALLELLLSEDRADRNEGEQERVKKYIQEVERLIRLHKDVQGRTEGGDKPEELAKDQAKVADRTGDLAKKIEENEEGGTSENDDSTEQPPGQKPSQPGDMPPDEKKPDEPKPGDDKPADEKPAEPSPSEKQPGDMKPGDEKPADQKPGEQKPGEQKPGEQKPGEPMPGQPMPGDPMPGEQKPGEPMPGQPMPGQPMPGQPGESQPMTPEQPPAQQNPARQRLQQAEQKMRDAQKKLEKAERDQAKEAQEQARQELEKAKAELEEILRQLREEEIERTLAQLEGRFRKMLEMELKVHEATERLADIPVAARTREVDIESSKLGVEQRKIALEADKAYQLLLEEGSSIAFPESVDEMRADMESVAERLAQTKLDQLTLGTEEDIIAALNEMIAALQQAQKDQEEKKQQQQQSPPMQGEPEDQPLVDSIAELKMIKAMQLRVNDRTKRYARLLTEPDDLTGQATDVDLARQIEKLGERQSRLQRITRDIVLGKNQ